jgi:hypothetical protein
MRQSPPKNPDEARKTRSGRDLTQKRNLPGWKAIPCSVEFLKHVRPMLFRFFPLVGNDARIGWLQPGFPSAAPGLGSLLQPIFFSLRHFISSSQRSRLRFANADRSLRWCKQMRPHPNSRCEYCRMAGSRFRAALAPWATPGRTFSSRLRPSRQDSPLCP